MDLGLKGRGVIVAASSQGIGLATAEAFAREGAQVAMCARTEKTLREAAAKVRKETGAEIFGKSADEVRPIASTTKIFVAMAVRKKGLDLDG